MKQITGLLYKYALKPILFCFPADSVHKTILKFGAFLGKYQANRFIISKIWPYQNIMLKQKISGLIWKNPIGLSAGFDYNADLVDILPSLGFGFHTVGTLTYHAYEGNPAPMLGRLPKSKSLLVNKGFKNAGIGAVLPCLAHRYSDTPRGVSIGATNKPYHTYQDMVDDIVSGFTLADTFDTFDYFELNISCPNLKNIKNLPLQISSPEGLQILLSALKQLGIRRPVYIKLPLERTHEEFQNLIDIAVPFDFIKGIIISNLAKDRTNPAFDTKEIAQAGVGNFSGKPTEKGANDLIAFARATYKDRFVIIGVGGVFSAKDAYTKIKAGADLVQLITGMIYEGPQLIGQINQGIVQLLKQDGYKSVSEAVGSSNANS